MTEFHLPEHDRRRFTRVALKLSAVLHQGGVSWDVELVDISLNGCALTQPAQWDADYSHPFNIALRLEDGATLEFFAHLIHVESGSLGFQMEHLGDEQIAPLGKLLESHLDTSVFAEELARLASEESG